MVFAAAPAPPRFDHHTDPGPLLGIGAARPRLTWTVPSAADGYCQTSYELQTSRGGRVQTYRVASAEQVLVPWPGPDLSSRESVTVRVRVAHGPDWSEWSPGSNAEAGLLDAGDWKAALISPTTLGQKNMPAPVLTGTLDVPATVERARLYATAHGLYVPTLNGHRVGDTVLTPGWTSYRHRLRYQTYDVTDLIGSATTSWSSCSATAGSVDARVGPRTALRGPPRAARPAGGHPDRRPGLGAGHRRHLDRPGQRGPGAMTCTTVNGPTCGGSAAVTPDPTPGRGDTQTWTGWSRPTGRRSASPSGSRPDSGGCHRRATSLVDFGQNLVGWVRLTVRGLAPGTEVTLRHAEVLEHGELAHPAVAQAPQRPTPTWWPEPARNGWSRS